MKEYQTKEYHRTKAQEHYANNKETYQANQKARRDRTRSIIAEAKRNGCVKCSEMNVVCLDFHHLGGKDQTVSSMLAMNDDRVRAEIAKCVVLCANCHRKHHAGLIEI
jgi:hypothetical protein